MGWGWRDGGIAVGRRDGRRERKRDGTLRCDGLEVEGRREKEKGEMYRCGFTCGEMYRCLELWSLQRLVPMYSCSFSVLFRVSFLAVK